MEAMASESTVNINRAVGADMRGALRGERLDVAGVTHAYAGAVVVSDVSFSIPAGGIAAILGPSGCGKSTMLRIVAGLVRPAAGTVAIGGRDVTAVPARERRVGMVFQNYALFPHMTVQENVGYGLSALPKGQRRARVAQLLDLVRLGSFAQRLPRQLSGGQQQRVAVARALAPFPSILLLDEPFAALDRALRADLQFEFVRLQRELGITTILVTHDQEEAQAVADTLIVMNAGKLEQVGTPATLYDRPQSLFVNTFVGQASVLPGTIERAGRAIRIASGDLLELPQAASFIDGAKIALVVRPEHVSLRLAPAPGAIPARRILAVPQGPLTLHDLALSDGTSLKAIEPRVPDAPATSLDAPIFVSFDLARCRIYPVP
jgi:putative spermidine/putrescine transport system ATP-binding protein